MGSQIESQKEYEGREIRSYLKQVDEITKAPLGDRKEAAAKYGEAMAKMPHVVAERVRWLLAGNYGYGSYLKAREVAADRNMNRVAALTNMAATIEWQCPARMAIDEWKKLTPAQQQTVNTAVAEVLRDWEEEEGVKPAPVRGVSGHIGKRRTTRVAKPRLTR